MKRAVPPTKPVPAKPAAAAAPAVAKPAPKPVLAAKPAPALPPKPAAKAPPVPAKPLAKAAPAVAKPAPKPAPAAVKPAPKAAPAVVKPAPKAPPVAVKAAPVKGKPAAAPTASKKGLKLGQKKEAANSSKGIVENGRTTRDAIVRIFAARLADQGLEPESLAQADQIIKTFENVYKEVASQSNFMFAGGMVKKKYIKPRVFASPIMKEQHSFAPGHERVKVDMPVGGKDFKESIKKGVYDADSGWFTPGVFDKVTKEFTQTEDAFDADAIVAEGKEIAKQYADAEKAAGVTADDSEEEETGEEAGEEEETADEEAGEEAVDEEETSDEEATEEE
jgi:hypothetical protein